MDDSISAEIVGCASQYGDREGQKKNGMKDVNSEGKENKVREEAR